MDLSSTHLFETLKKTQQRQTLLLNLLRGQRKTSDSDTMMRAASEEVCRYLQVERAGFFEVQNERLHFLTGCATGRLPPLTCPMAAAGIGTGYLKEVRAGRVLGIADARSNPLTSDSLFAQIGTASLIGVPIIRHGVWTAGFYVNHPEKREWAEDDVELVQMVGEQTWDAVERARAERALRKSEERLTLALEAAGGVGTWDWDIQDDRMYSDARYAWLFSVDAQKAAEGVPMAEYIRGIKPGDRDCVGEQISRAIATGADYSVEFRVLPRDGSVRWVHARGRCHRDRSGKPVRLPGVVVDITERKANEFLLQQQWQMFDVALSNTPDFTYIFDLKGRFTYSNRGLLSLLNRKLEDLIGRDFHDLQYPTELADRLEKQIQQVIGTRQPVRDHTPFTSPDGRTRMYEYIFVPILSAKGVPEGVAGSTRDVTDRIAAEQLLEEDRRRWRELLLRAPAAIAVLRGPEHRYEWVNDGYSRLVEKPADSLYGKRLLDVLPDAEGRLYAGLLDDVYRTGEPVSGHESLCHVQRSEGGRDLFVNFVCMPTVGTSGQIYGTFVHITDVTDMVVARKRIEESEARFRNLADSMPQIVWTAKPDGEIDYYNERWYQFAGAGAADGWLKNLHLEDARRTCETWEACLATGEPLQTEMRMRDPKAERWRWFMCRAVAARGSSGEIEKWFGTCTDIDEEKASQQAVLQAQKLDSIGLLAGGIAHDFNNLLVGIMGGASFALNKIPQNHVTYPLLQTMLSASERAAHLTRQMLAYAGKGKFIIEPVDISELAMQTLPLVSASVPKSVQVKLQLQECLPPVETDVGQMQQVVMNLIINAAEAVGDRNGVVVVRTRLEDIAAGQVRRGVDGNSPAAGSYVVFEVQDTGCGMDGATVSRIFDPFFTTKFTGRGLGLAAVSGVVRSNRGSMEVESEQGRGSTFRVLLPAMKGRAAGAPSVASGAICRGRETVLVIDDEPVVLLLATTTLEESGYVSIAVGSGQAGLEQIRSKPEIDLVLLDMSMPEMSGRQVMEAITLMRPALRVAICSGYSEQEVLKEFSGLKLAGVIQKPFTVGGLATHVRSILDNALSVN